MAQGIQSTHVIIFLVLWQGMCSVTNGSTAGGYVNLTEFILHRQKRFLTFANGGNIKVVMGPILPIDLGDPVPWRNILILYNLQGLQYDIASNPLYPWDKWEGLFSRAMPSDKLMNYDEVNLNQIQEDDARLFAYTALESFMDRRSDGWGRECLLRSICENAQVYQHVGLFAEVLDIILTPGKTEIDSIYRHARSAGLGGADCYQQYQLCPKGANFLDEYLDVL